MVWTHNPTLRILYDTYTYTSCIRVSTIYLHWSRDLEEDSSGPNFIELVVIEKPCTDQTAKFQLQ